MRLRIGWLCPVHHLPATDEKARVLECVLQVAAATYALPEKSVAEIGPVTLRCASERSVYGVRRRKHDGIVVRQRRDKHAGKASRDDDDAVLDSFVVERGRNELRRQLARGLVGKFQ